MEEIVASNPPAPPCMTEKGASILYTLKEPPPSWTSILYAYSNCSYRLRTWTSALWTQTANISATILAGDTKLWNGAETLRSTAYFVSAIRCCIHRSFSIRFIPDTILTPLVTGQIRLYLKEASLNQSFTFAAGNQSPVYFQEVLDIRTQKSCHPRITPNQHN